ncbi:protein FilA, partial [Acinetobacter baumannii]|nr:protein FilA [Acinetobacter baumannii]
VYLQGVHLGTAASIGDVEVQGLNIANSTITISGH